jgi:glycerophosphoryl diester phosphodiesterase
MNVKITHLFMIWSALAFWACKATEKKPLPTPAGFDWQGHRGCRGILPENSVPAFLKALEYPEVTTLELDLAVSKDNKLIVSHEPWFNSAICTTPNGDSLSEKDGAKILLYQLSAEQIRGYDCGSKGNKRFPEQSKMAVHKPTFKEVVEAVKEKHPDRFKSIRWNIEIKSEAEWDGLRTPPVETFAALVIQEIRQLGIDKRSNVQSFDLRALEAMHRQAPDIPLAYLIENMDSVEKNLKKLSFKPQIYSPYYLTISKKTLRICRENGIKLIPWTVNDVTAMRRLIRLGVDGIITDYPNRIASATTQKQ